MYYVAVRSNKKKKNKSYLSLQARRHTSSRTHLVGDRVHARGVFGAERNWNRAETSTTLGSRHRTSYLQLLLPI
jgi:hypothetical protein